MTPQGTQAYAILDWAYEDPAERAAEGLRRVSELARSLTADGGQALREVQDAGTMLSRLSQSVSFQAGAGKAGSSLNLGKLRSEAEGGKGFSEDAWNAAMAVAGIESPVSAEEDPDG